MRRASDAAVVVVAGDSGLGEMLQVALSLAGFQPAIYSSIREALAMHPDSIKTVIVADSTTVGDRDAARLRHAHPDALIVAGVPSMRETSSWADMTLPMVELGMIPQVLVAPETTTNVIELPVPHAAKRA